MRLRWCPEPWFNWRDLIVLIRHSGVNSELYKSMHPDDAGWTLTNMLLAAIADCLRWLQWSRTKDGQKNRDAPEPIKRPGVKGRKKPVHPVGKGAPRSKIRKLLGRGGRETSTREQRLQRLGALFSSDDGR